MPPTSLCAEQATTHSFGPRCVGAQPGTANPLLGQAGVMRADQFPVPYDGETVYHYTDAGGLIGMVKNHALWATEAGGMNDPREGRFGVDALRAHVAPEDYAESYRDHLGRIDSLDWTNTYVACATTRRDDVSQWVRYAGFPDVGYSVGLNTSTPLHVARDNDVRVDTDSPWVLYFDSVGVSPWSPVLYGQEGLRHALADFHTWAQSTEDVTVTSDTSAEDFFVESQIARDTVTGALSDLAQLIKDGGFSTEAEVRLVARPLTESSFVKYRGSRYGVVRYVELVAGNSVQGFVVRRETERESWARLPITSVTIGPSPFAERGRDSVVHLLKSNGYPHVDVLISDVKVR